MLLKLLKPALIIFLVFSFAFIFSNSMARPLERDENMYCTAGVLISQGQLIYKDFSYVSQMPYQPLLFGLIYKVSGTTYYLLTARIISCIADFLTVLFIILIYRKIFSTAIFSGFLLGLASAILFLFNPIINYSSGLAWNHNIVICLAAASFWIYMAAENKQGKALYIKTTFLTALLSAASCIRITTVLVELLFFTAIILRKYESKKDRNINIVIFIITSAVVFAWPVWTILQAPQAFLINMFTIPNLNSQLLFGIGFGRNKLMVTLYCITIAEYLFPILVAIYLYVCMFRRSALKNIASFVYLSILLPLIFFAIAYIPPTIWEQYFAPPVPFLLISLAFPLYFFKQKKDVPHFNIACSLLAACVLIAIFQQAAFLKPIANLSRPQQWKPVGLHNLSQQMAQSIDKKGPVLTVSPLYALEGGLQIYPQLSAGLFVYRVADNLSPQQRRLTNTVGPNSLKHLTIDIPPAAVIAGTEKGSGFDKIESTLLEVTDPNWRRQQFENLIIYTRP